jgi:hypothetical protein
MAGHTIRRHKARKNASIKLLSRSLSNVNSSGITIIAKKDLISGEKSIIAFVLMKL